jgi:hypothetical protein
MESDQCTLVYFFFFCSRDECHARVGTGCMLSHVTSLVTGQSPIAACHCCCVTQPNLVVGRIQRVLRSFDRVHLVTVQGQPQAHTPASTTVNRSKALWIWVN